MKDNFIYSATGQKLEPMVIIANWEGACHNPDTKKFRFDVLEFVCAAKKAGHDVMIIYSLPAPRFEEQVKSAIEIGDDIKSDFSVLNDMQCVTRTEIRGLARIGLKIDIALDSKPIEDAPNSTYAKAVLQIELDCYNNLFPLTLNGLYQYCGLPQPKPELELEPIMYAPRRLVY